LLETIVSADIASYLLVNKTSNEGYRS